ncbi:MAG: AraC family transcriptional regulator [Kiritimatiellae bacterium]|nr:AraC family transcriptional regulator [Kiritimatiellia bacterium]MDD5520771.1 AraC family transcriptional regulator [Kiritimatiellia bacterium]
MKLIRGRDIGSRLVGHIGAIRSHKAQRITWHSHGGFELLFLLDGEIAYEFRGKPAIQVSGGFLLVVPPKLIHRGVGNVRAPSTICGIEYNPGRHDASRNSPFTTHDLMRLETLLQRSSLTVRPFGPDLRRIVKRLFEMVEQCADHAPDSMTKARIRALSCSALVEAASDLSVARNTGPKEFIAAAIRYLENRFHEPLRIEDLVKHLGFSRARVFELFKNQTGMTPNDYLLRYRVRKAQEMLMDPEKTVTETGFAVGFSSSQYFSQVFRKYTGQTPSKYRKSLK